MRAESGGPLAGLRVVEFSHMVMGPSSGMLLADLGAEVIKVEPIGGDKTRELPGSGAGFFPMYSRNKRSVCVDVKTPDGVEFVKRLLSTADVLTENFRPGVVERLGLGYETLREEFPQLIYCSMKGFLSGPYEDRAALDEVVQMMGGLAYMTGPEGRPLRAGASVNDVMGGVFAVVGILAALRERESTHEGSLVRSALFENNVFLVGQHMAQFAVTGEPAAPMPSRLSAWAVYDVFATRDNAQAFVGSVSDSQWRKLCDAFGLSDLAEDPDLSSNPDRVARRDRFMPRLRAVIAGLDLADVLSRCQDAGLPYAPVVAPHELYDDPHLTGSPGALQSVHLADGRELKLPAVPLELNGERPRGEAVVEKAGQSTREVGLTLGYTDDQLAEMCEQRFVHWE